MSEESSFWLNNYTLIGYTDTRGYAWHYRESSQGTRPNHYPGSIPVEDVIERLFNFEVLDAPIYIINGEGEYVEVPNRKAMVTDDTYDVLGVFKGGYRGHAYKEWLIDNVAVLLSKNGHELGIGSAGLLKNRAQAWVSIEMPENITTPEGVSFRPYILGATSYDGSIATTNSCVNQLTVCDNTLAVALSEGGRKFKVKHSKYSTLKIGEARQAMGIIFEMADDFKAEVAKLTSWKVSEAQFESLLSNVVPVPEEKGRAQTMATNKRDQIVKLYRADERAAAWNGTAFGVLQAFNTYNHHYANIKGNAPRVVRNMENVISGKMADADNNILEALEVVCR